MADSKNSSERCVLCLDQKRSPVHIQCGHSFCYSCLDVYKSYKKYPWANKCPICRDVLEVKKKTTKRRYSEINEAPQNSAINSRTEIQNNTSSTVYPSTASPQANIFEEFMALAFDVYENVQEPYPNLAPNADDYYGEVDDEAPTTYEVDDDIYGDEFNYHTDSEEYDEYQDFDDDYDDEHNYYSFADEDSYQPTHTHRHVDDSYYYAAADNDYNVDEGLENTFANDDEPVDYEDDDLMTRDWNNNLNSDTYWEPLNASDVVIID